MTKDYYELIKEHESLIYKISCKFFGLDKQELFQAGVIGLIKAARNYKKDSLAKFSTYAYDYIFGEMYLLSQEQRNLKLNKDTLRLYKSIEEAKNLLTQKLNKVPSNDEIALFLEIDIKLVNSIIAATLSMLSLNEQVGVEKETALYEIIPEAKSDNIDDKIVIEQSMKNLSKDEQKIIDYRYFKDFTQSETAKAMSMTQAMVSRYEKKSLEKMRGFISY